MQEYFKKPKRRYEPVFYHKGKRPIFSPVEQDHCVPCVCRLMHYFDLPDPVPYVKEHGKEVYRQTQRCLDCGKPVVLCLIRRPFVPVLLKGGKE